MTFSWWLVFHVFLCFLIVLLACYGTFILMMKMVDNQCIKKFRG